MTFKLWNETYQSKDPETYPGFHGLAGEGKLMNTSQSGQQWLASCTPHPSLVVASSPLDWEQFSRCHLRCLGLQGNVWL